MKNEIASKHIEIDTIHKYQGREKEIIVLSTVSDQYDEFMDNANLLNVAISRAENKLIIIVSDNEEFKALSKVLHYPLNMLIRDTSKLDEKELKYVTNSLTHTDFFIFRKIDKAPVLVVEVDGYAFHDNNPKQLERDRMKDRILEKYNIPILRLTTNGSREEEKLTDKLSEILKFNLEEYS